MGFEPTVRITTDNTLAGCRFKPLIQLSKYELSRPILTVHSLTGDNLRSQSSNSQTIQAVSILGCVHSNSPAVPAGEDNVLGLDNIALQGLICLIFIHAFLLRMQLVQTSCLESKMLLTYDNP